MRKAMTILTLLITASMAFWGCTIKQQRVRRPIEEIEKRLKAPEFKRPEIYRTELPNGMVVLIIEKHDIPIVSVKVEFRKAGAAYEPEDKAGLANLTAQLLRQGTGRRTATQISEEIDFVGGRLSTGVGSRLSSGYDVAGASVLVLKEHLDLGLDLLSDIILNPSFDQEEIDKKKSEVISGIITAEANPRNVGRDAFNELVFGRHPYHRPSVGYKETIPVITRDDIVDFHQKFYRPNNAVMAVVGDVGADEMISKIEDYFSSWERYEAEEHVFPAPPEIEKRTIHMIHRDVTQSFIFMGHVGVQRGNPDFYPLILMNYILGGGGSISRIYQEVRERQGLAYDVHSSFQARLYPGPFLVTAQTRNVEANRSVKSVIAEIERIRNSPVTDEEIRSAKGYFNGSFPSWFETNEQLAGILLFIELHGFGEEYFTEYLERVNAVTKEDVMRVAKEYLDPENCVLVVVANVEEAKEGFEDLGEIEVMEREEGEK